MYIGVHMYVFIYVGMSAQSDGDNDIAYINKAYTNNPMINRSSSPNRSPLEDPLLPFNSPITFENCKISHYDTSCKNTTNGVSTMTNGVSPMTNGVSPMTNGISTMTNGVSPMTSPMTKGVSKITNGINCKYDESNEDDVINIDSSADTDGGTVTEDKTIDSEDIKLEPVDF
jgi:hypothetical protein